MKSLVESFCSRYGGGLVFASRACYYRLVQKKLQGLIGIWLESEVGRTLEVHCSLMDRPETLRQAVMASCTEGERGASRGLKIIIRSEVGHR